MERFLFVVLMIEYDFASVRSFGFINTIIKRVNIFFDQRMKLDFKIFAIIGIHTVEPCENTGKESCFLSELVEPDHFAEWDCSSPEFLG